MLNNINTCNRSLYNTLLKYVIEFTKGMFPYLFVNNQLLPIKPNYTPNVINYNKKLVNSSHKTKKKLLYQISSLNNNLNYDDFNIYNKPYSKTRYKVHISYNCDKAKNNLKNMNSNIYKDIDKPINHKLYEENKFSRVYNKYRNKKTDITHNIDFFKHNR